MNAHHVFVNMQSIVFSLASKSIGSDHSIEQKCIIMGGGIGREYERRSVIDSAKYRTSRSKFSEDKWVVLETKFEDMRVNLSEIDKGVAGLQ